MKPLFCYASDINQSKYQNTVFWLVNIQKQMNSWSTDIKYDVLTRFFFMFNMYVSILPLTTTKLKFIYSEKATKFGKSPPIICPMYCQSNNWWRFRKILWPSQNIWTLAYQKSDIPLFWYSFLCFFHKKIHKWLQLFSETNLHSYCHGSTYPSRRCIDIP